MAVESTNTKRPSCQQSRTWASVPAELSTALTNTCGSRRAYRPLQGHRFLQNFVAQIPVQSCEFDPIDPPAEPVFEIRHQSSRKERTMVRPYIDEKVHIAFRSHLTACHGTEYPHIASTVTGSDAENLGAFVY